MIENIDAAAGFIGAHPQWAGVLVCLVAAAEAVVVVGYLLPGTAILIAVGGVVGLGHLSLWPIMLWATLGAVIGDGFSYALGYHYREGLRARWPFRRYPALLAQGDAFFRRHGAKSVFLGRFIPVLKPIVPVVAGILGVKPSRFYAANVLSAILWAPAHILPGVLLGASLGLLHDVSRRLVAAAIGAVVVLVLALWVARATLMRVLPMLALAHRRAFEAARGARWRRLHALALHLDPDDPSTPGVLLALGIGAAAGAGFLGLLVRAAAGEPGLGADHVASQFLQGLRTQWTDEVMTAVTGFGDGAALAPLAAALVLWLLARRDWPVAIATAATLVLSELAVSLVKGLTRIARPEALYSGLDAFSFPSGHATMVTVVYGVAAWLAARGLGRRGAAVVFGLTAAWVLAIGFSRVYLGAHWPSDVAAGWLLGTCLVAALAIGCRRSGARMSGFLGGVLLAVTVAGGSWHYVHNFPRAVNRYEVVVPPTPIAWGAWERGDWMRLPATRIDLTGEPEEPLVLQWAGTAGALERRLLVHGWRRPPPWSVRSALGFLRPAAPLAGLPVPPSLHEGREPALTVVRPGLGELSHVRWVLRAWSSGFVLCLGAPCIPVLVASVTAEQALRPAGMLTVIRTVRVPAMPLEHLASGLVGRALRVQVGGREVLLAGAGIISR